MSLLLDALKKAAKERQAAEGVTEEDEVAANPAHDESPGELSADLPDATQSLGDDGLGESVDLGPPHGDLDLGLAASVLEDGEDGSAALVSEDAVPAMTEIIAEGDALPEPVDVDLDLVLDESPLALEINDSVSESSVSEDDLAEIAVTTDDALMLSESEAAQPDAPPEQEDIDENHNTQSQAYHEHDYESINHEGPTHENISHENISHETIDHGTLSHQNLNHENLIDESIDHESIEHEAHADDDAYTQALLSQSDAPQTEVADTPDETAVENTGLTGPLAEVVERSVLVQRVLGAELSGAASPDTTPTARGGKNGKAKKSNTPPHGGLSQEAALSALMQSNGRRTRGPLLGAGIVSVVLVLAGGAYFFLQPTLQPSHFQHRQTLTPLDLEQPMSGVIRSSELMAGLPTEDDQLVGDPLDGVEGQNDADAPDTLEMEDTLTLGELDAQGEPVAALPSAGVSDRTEATNAEPVYRGDIPVTERNNLSERRDLPEPAEPAEIAEPIQPAQHSYLPEENSNVQNPQSQVALIAPNPNNAKRLEVEAFSQESQPHRVEPLPQNNAAPVSNQAVAEQPYWSDAPISPGQWQEFEDPEQQAQLQVRGGYADFQQGFYQAAERHYERALAYDPYNKDAHLGLAGLAQMAGDLPEALARFNQVLQEWPNDEIARAGLSSLIQRENDVALETELKLLLEKYPDSPHLSFVLGNIYAQRGTWQVAQKKYFTAWSGDSANTNYLYNLAISLDQLGEHEAAIQFYEMLVAEKPTKRSLYSLAAVMQRLAHLRSQRSRGGR